MPTVEVKFNQLLDTLKSYLDEAKLDEVKLAFDFARDAHQGQNRKSGEEYIYHPLGAAQILANMQMNEKLIIAALLHDVPEDTKATLDDIRKKFGDEIAELVDHVTKLGNIKYRGIERYIENLRKMFLAMASDIRVIIIKFADKLNNLNSLYALPRDKQLRIANEVLEIYAPIAGRLGMYEMKGMLEEEAFKYTNPKEYNNIKLLIEKEFVPRAPEISSVIEKVKNVLDGYKVPYKSVKGRYKHLYSLYNKLSRYDQNPARIYDYLAIRIVTDTIPECYNILGYIHSSFVPIKGKFKDYISQPKPNGYRSLHTTVFTGEEDGNTFEVQIRTQEMDERAEYGIASHWTYKEGIENNVDKEKIRWIEELTQWKHEFIENKKYLENLKTDVFRDLIFVFTPKGDVIELPEHATPIDFAYHLHTEIGNQCIGALVNNHIVQLDTPLKSGDVVEIMRNKGRKYPNSDWLKFVNTSLAKNKIKTALKAKPLLDKFLKKK